MITITDKVNIIAMIIVLKIISNKAKNNNCKDDDVSVAIRDVKRFTIHVLGFKIAV